MGPVLAWASTSSSRRAVCGLRRRPWPFCDRCRRGVLSGSAVVRALRRSVRPRGSSARVPTQAIGVAGLRSLRGSGTRVGASPEVPRGARRRPLARRRDGDRAFRRRAESWLRVRCRAGGTPSGDSIRPSPRGQRSAGRSTSPVATVALSLVSTDQAQRDAAERRTAMRGSSTTRNVGPVPGTCSWLTTSSPHRGPRPRAREVLRATRCVARDAARGCPGAPS